MRNLQLNRAWRLLCSIVVISSAVSPDNGIRIPQLVASNTPWWKIVPMTPISSHQHTGELEVPGLTCISADQTIFNIMQESKVYCRGHDYRVTFYYQNESDYINLGTTVINKYLFHNLLLKYRNWSLSSEKINSTVRKYNPKHNEGNTFYDNKFVKSSYNNPYYNEIWLNPDRSSKGKIIQQEENICDYFYHDDHMPEIIVNKKHNHLGVLEERKVNDYQNNRIYNQVIPRYHSQFKPYVISLPANRDTSSIPTIINAYIDLENKNDKNENINSMENDMLQNEHKSKVSNLINLDEQNLLLGDDVSDLRISEVVDLLFDNDNYKSDITTPVIFNLPPNHNLEKDPTYITHDADIEKYYAKHQKDNAYSFIHMDTDKLVSAIDNHEYIYQPTVEKNPLQSYIASTDNIYEYTDRGSIDYMADSLRKTYKSEGTYSNDSPKAVNFKTYNRSNLWRDKESLNWIDSELITDTEPLLVETKNSKYISLSSLSPIEKVQPHTESNLPMSSYIESYSPTPQYFVLKHTSDTDESEVPCTYTTETPTNSSQKDSIILSKNKTNLEPYSTQIMNGNTNPLIWDSTDQAKVGLSDFDSSFYSIDTNHTPDTLIRPTYEEEISKISAATSKENLKSLVNNSYITPIISTKPHSAVEIISSQFASAPYEENLIQPIVMAQPKPSLLEELLTSAIYEPIQPTTIPIYQTTDKKLSLPTPNVHRYVIPLLSPNSVRNEAYSISKTIPVLQPHLITLQPKSKNVQSLLLTKLNTIKPILTPIYMHLNPHPYRALSNMNLSRNKEPHMIIPLTTSTNDKIKTDNSLTYVPEYTPPSTLSQNITSDASPFTSITTIDTKPINEKYNPTKYEWNDKVQNFDVNSLGTPEFVQPIPLTSLSSPSPMTLSSITNPTSNFLSPTFSSSIIPLKIENVTTPQAQEVSISPSLPPVTFKMFESDLKHFLQLPETVNEHSAAPAYTTLPIETILSETPRTNKKKTVTKIAPHIIHYSPILQTMPMYSVPHLGNRDFDKSMNFKNSVTPFAYGYCNFCTNRKWLTSSPPKFPSILQKVIPLTIKSQPPIYVNPTSNNLVLPIVTKTLLPQTATTIPLENMPKSCTSLTQPLLPIYPTTPGNVVSPLTEESYPSILNTNSPKSYSQHVLNDEINPAVLFISPISTISDSYIITSTDKVSQIYEPYAEGLTMASPLNQILKFKLANSAVSPSAAYTTHNYNSQSISYTYLPLDKEISKPILSTYAEPLQHKSLSQKSLPITTLYSKEMSQQFPISNSKITFAGPKPAPTSYSLLKENEITITPLPPISNSISQSTLQAIPYEYVIVQLNQNDTGVSQISSLPLRKYEYQPTPPDDATTSSAATFTTPLIENLSALSVNSLISDNLSPISTSELHITPCEVPSVRNIPISQISLITTPLVNSNTLKSYPTPNVSPFYSTEIYEAKLETDLPLSPAVDTNIPFTIVPKSSTYSERPTFVTPLSYPNPCMKVKISSIPQFEIIKSPLAKTSALLWPVNYNTLTNYVNSKIVPDVTPIKTVQPLSIIPRLSTAAYTCPSLLKPISQIKKLVLDPMSSEYNPIMVESTSIPNMSLQIKEPQSSSTIPYVFSKLPLHYNPLSDEKKQSILLDHLTPSSFKDSQYLTRQTQLKPIPFLQAYETQLNPMNVIPSLPISVLYPCTQWNSVPQAVRPISVIKTSEDDTATINSINSDGILSQMDKKVYDDPIISPSKFTENIISKPCSKFNPIGYTEQLINTNLKSINNRGNYISPINIKPVTGSNVKPVPITLQDTPHITPNLNTSITPNETVLSSLLLDSDDAKYYYRPADYIKYVPRPKLMSSARMPKKQVYNDKYTHQIISPLQTAEVENINIETVKSDYLQSLVPNKYIPKNTIPKSRLPVAVSKDHVTPGLTASISYKEPILTPYKWSQSNSNAVIPIVSNVLPCSYQPLTYPLPEPITEVSISRKSKTQFLTPLQFEQEVKSPTISLPGVPHTSIQPIFTPASNTVSYVASRNRLPLAYSVTKPITVISQTEESSVPESEVQFINPSEKLVNPSLNSLLGVPYTSSESSVPESEVQFINPSEKLVNPSLNSLLGVPYTTSIQPLFKPLSNKVTNIVPCNFLRLLHPITILNKEKSRTEDSLSPESGIHSVNTKIKPSLNSLLGVPHPSVQPLFTPIFDRDKSVIPCNYLPLLYPISKPNIEKSLIEDSSSPISKICPLSPLKYEPLLKPSFKSLSSVPHILIQSQLTPISCKKASQNSFGLSHSKYIPLSPVLLPTTTPHTPSHLLKDSTPCHLRYTELISEPLIPIPSSSKSTEYSQGVPIPSVSSKYYDYCTPLESVSNINSLSSESALISPLQPSDLSTNLTLPPKSVIGTLLKLKEQDSLPSININAILPSSTFLNSTLHTNILPTIPFSLFNNCTTWLPILPKTVHDQDSIPGQVTPELVPLYAEYISPSLPTLQQPKATLEFAKLNHLSVFPNYKLSPALKVKPLVSTPLPNYSSISPISFSPFKTLPDIFCKPLNITVSKTILSTSLPVQPVSLNQNSEYMSTSFRPVLGNEGTPYLPIPAYNRFNSETISQFSPIDISKLNPTAFVALSSNNEMPISNLQLTPSESMKSEAYNTLKSSPNTSQGLLNHISPLIPSYNSIISNTLPISNGPFSAYRSVSPITNAQFTPLTVTQYKTIQPVINNVINPISTTNIPLQATMEQPLMTDVDTFSDICQISTPNVTPPALSYFIIPQKVPINPFKYVKMPATPLTNVAQSPVPLTSAQLLNTAHEVHPQFSPISYTDYIQPDKTKISLKENMLPLPSVQILQLSPPLPEISEYTIAPSPVSTSNLNEPPLLSPGSNSGNQIMYKPMLPYHLKPCSRADEKNSPEYKINERLPLQSDPQITIPKWKELLLSPLLPKPLINAKYIDETSSINPNYVTTAPCIAPQQNRVFGDNPNYLMTDILDNAQVNDLKNTMKSNLQNYINKNENIQSGLYNTNGDITIPLGKIVIAKKDCTIPAIHSFNPSVGYKTWRSNLKLVEAKLYIKFKDMSVNNFQPIVYHLNVYNVNEIENLFKKYIESKYGNVIVVNNNNSLNSQYEVLKNCSNICDNRCNLLWPTDTSGQWSKVYKDIL